jgi:hypothetical protein
LAEQCDRLAAACDRTATDVEYAKLEYIGALVMLAAALAALTASLVAGGVSVLGMPAAIAFAQFSIRLILTRLISSILVGIGFIGGMDVAFQLGQILNGHRHEWDWSRTLRAAEDGAVFGGVAGLGFLGLGRVIAPTIGRVAGIGSIVGTSAGTGLVGGTLAPLAHGERPDPTDIAKATLVSALSAYGLPLHGSKGHAIDAPAMDDRAVAAVADGSLHLDGLAQPAALADQIALHHDDPDLAGPARHETPRIDQVGVARVDRDVDPGAGAVRAADHPGASPVTRGDVRPVDAPGPGPTHPDPSRPVDVPARAAVNPPSFDRLSDGSSPAARAGADGAPMPARTGADGLAPPVRAGADGAAPPSRPEVSAAEVTTQARTSPEGTSPGPARAGLDGSAATPAPPPAEIGILVPVIAAPHGPATDAHPRAAHPDPTPVSLEDSPTPTPHHPVTPEQGWAARGSWRDPTGAPDPLFTGPGSPAVQHLVDRARAAEPTLAVIVRDVADRTGGTLVGLDMRLKTADSISIKLTRYLRDNPGDSLPQGLAEMNDTVRYTIVFPDEAYVAGAQAAIDDLAAQLQPVRDRRSWDNSAGYLGVNSVWFHDGTGHTFEVQLHTPDSFAAKSVTHAMYKKLQVSEVELPELRAEHDARFATVNVPDGAHSVGIPDSPVRHRPTMELPDDIVARSAGPYRSPDPDDFQGPDDSADPGHSFAGAPDDIASTLGSSIADFLDLPVDPRRHVSDAEALALVRQHVVRTDAGLAFYPVHDQMRDFAAGMHPAAGLVTLDVHGSRTGFQVDYGLVTPEQLAAALRDLRASGVLDLPEGTALKLVSCDTAYGGEQSPAARLARALGVEVVAPDEPIWTSIDGFEIVSSPTVVQGNLLPNIPPDGAWHRFSASGREIPLGANPSGRGPGSSGSRPAGFFMPRDELSGLDPPA